MRRTPGVVLALSLALSGFASAQQDPPPPEEPPAGTEEAPPPDETPPTPKEAPAPKPDTSSAGLAEQALGFPVTGTLTIKYRARWNYEDDDQDFYGYLSTDIGNPKKHTLTAHFFLRGTKDIDGNHAGSRYFVFDSITDTYEESWNGRLYYGYLDLHRVGPIESARLGRQVLNETPIPVYIDGLNAESKPWKEALSLQGGLYGGIPVHPFESSPSGDWIAGAWAQVKPWKGARVRADYTAIRDDYRDEVYRSDLVGLAVWQQVADVLTLSGTCTILDSSSRDYRVSGVFYDPAWDFKADLSWYQLLHRQRMSSIDTDLFTPVGGDYQPYGQGRLLLAKGFGDHVTIEGGAEIREVWDVDREGKFNRSFQRYFLTPGLKEWPIAGFSLSVTGEYWHVRHTQDGSTKSVGGDLTYAVLKNLKASLGSNFALYKYDLYEQIEKEHVQTYYAKVTYSPWKPLKLNLAYEMESLDRDKFHAVKVAVSFTF